MTFETCLAMVRGINATYRAEHASATARAASDLARLTAVRARQGTLADSLDALDVRPRARQAVDRARAWRRGWAPWGPA